MAVPMYRNMDQSNEEKGSGDTLSLVAGVSLMIFGAGLLMSNPTVRRNLSRVNLRSVADIAQAVLPDLERYLRTRSI